jgi:hypothetical protein
MVYSWYIHGICFYLRIYVCHYKMRISTISNIIASFISRMIMFLGGMWRIYCSWCYILLFIITIQIPLFLVTICQRYVSNKEWFLFRLTLLMRCQVHSNCFCELLPFSTYASIVYILYWNDFKNETSEDIRSNRRWKYRDWFITIHFLILCRMFRSFTASPTKTQTYHAYVEKERK